jgi:hypothetical protein
MQIEQIKEVLHATPFLPFRIRTADGKSIPVLHQEVTLLAPKDKLLFVVKEQGGFYLIDSESVTHLETVSDPIELQRLINEARSPKQ